MDCWRPAPEQAVHALVRCRRQGAAPLLARWDQEPSAPSPPRCGPSRHDKRPAGPPLRRCRGRRCSGRGAVHFAHVDQALHPISERVKGPGHVLPVHTEVERKWCARPAGCRRRGAHAPQRLLLRPRATCRRPPPRAHLRPLATTSRTRVLRSSRSRASLLRPVLACPLDDPVAGRRAATRPGVDEQHGPPRRLGRAPATTHQCREPGRGMRWTVHVSAAIVTAFLRVLPGDPTPGGAVDSGRSKAGSPGSRLGCGRLARRSLGQAGAGPRRTTRVGTITLISPSRRAAFTDLGDDSPAWLKRSPRGSPW